MLYRGPPVLLKTLYNSMSGSKMIIIMTMMVVVVIMKMMMMKGCGLTDVYLTK